MPNLSRRALLRVGLVAAGAGIVGCAATGPTESASASGPRSALPGSSTTSSSPSAAASSVTPIVRNGGAPSPAGSSVAGSPARASARPSVPAAPTTPAHAGSGTARATAITPLGPATQVVTGPTGASQVALTFHGQGDIAIARQILKIVAARKVHITVMVVGTWLDRYHGIAREILAGGHELGNHTWSHMNFQALPEDRMLQEVVKCRETLLRYAGTPGDYFRPSKTHYASDQTRRVAGLAGYRTVLSYDIDSLDFTEPGGAVRANVRAARAGSIVSMHFGYHSTVEALPHILDDFAARGLSAVTAGTLLGS